jgi:predicted nucleotidyltransferase
MSMLTENDITRITRRITGACDPIALGVFGSYAIGTAHEKSDLDILVIRRAPGARGARARTVRRALFGILHPIDIQVFSPEEFEDSVYEAQSFNWIIVQQVHIYHWTSGAAEAVPSLAQRLAATCLKS